MLKMLSLLSCLVWSYQAIGADHIDSAAAVAEPLADISDIYSWMNSDNTKLNLVMNVNFGATTETKFSEAIQYVFWVNSMAAYGGTATKTQITCTFATDQTISCWAGADEYVTGDGSSTDGITSSSGKLKVFAGLRDDPFFMNFTGFTETVKTVKAAASGLSFNNANCPALDSATVTALVTQLKTVKDGGAPVNFFAGGKVMTISIQVDKTIVNSGGPILGVWGATYKKS